MGGIIGGVIGGIGQYAAAKQQAKATEKAAELALTGYNYLTTGAGKAANQSYIDTGGQANNMMAQLLGVPTGPAAGTGSTAGNALTGPNGKIMGMAGGNSAQAAYNAANAAPVATQAPNANTAFNNYLNSTAYGFQFGQGQDAISSSAAARGLLNSGATAKALTQYGQNLAGTTFNNFLGQLGNLSAAGQNALTRTANAGAAGGGGAASAMIANGDARAAGTVGLANSIGNAVGGLFNGFNSGGNSNMFPPAPSSGSALQAMGII